MTREFNSPPDEQPDDNFLEALSENLGKLDDTPVDEIFQSMDAADLAQMEAELDALGPEAFAGWEEDDDEPPAVNKDDIWDFQQKFDGPGREYNETARDITLKSFRSAKSVNFRYNSDCIRTGPVGERSLDFSYEISDYSEFRTRITEIPNDDQTPMISITHREFGVNKESSTYVFEKDTGLVHRYDQPYDPEKEELRSRLINNQDLSYEELEETAQSILDGFYHGLEVQDDEERLGVNGRPVDWSEIVHVKRIIDQSRPIKYLQ